MSQTVRQPNRDNRKKPGRNPFLVPFLLVSLLLIAATAFLLSHLFGRPAAGPEESRTAEITEPPTESGTIGGTDRPVTAGTDPLPTETEPITEPVTEPPTETEPVTEPPPSTSGKDPVDPGDRNVVSSFSFAAAGDVLIHECVFLDAASLAKEGQAYDFAPMFEGIRSLIAGRDLAFVNMECPIAGNEFGARGYPDFNAPEESGITLVKLGFNVVNIANNHMLDMDPVTTGYANSVRFWKSQPVLMIGGYENETDYYTVRNVTVNGITVAFLSYTYGTGTVGSVNAGSPKMVVPKIKDRVIKEQVAEARKTADLVFVSMHWGTDSAEKVTDEQVRLGQLLADAGADLIIGTHSHTVQPIQWLTGRNGNRTLCIYSLGNLISSQLYKKLILEDIVTLNVEKYDDGTCGLSGVIANPVVCHFETRSGETDGLGFAKRYNIRLYRLDEYTEELCAVHGAHLAYGSYKKSSEKFTVASLIADFRKLIDESFLPDWIK